MTEGHEHREIRLKYNGLALRMLTKPLIRTMDYDRVEHSRWVWGLTTEPGQNGSLGEVYSVYVLTPLGILHTLTGLTVRLK